VVLLGIITANVGCKSKPHLEVWMAMFGYARVSTRDQDFAGLVAVLTAGGCAKLYR
jgi:hypothetical protein